MQAGIGQNAIRNDDSLIDPFVQIFPALLNKSEGSLVLFSSRKQMLDVYEQLPDDLCDLILLQGDSSKQEMLNQHKQKISFWLQIAAIAMMLITA